MKRTIHPTYYTYIVECADGTFYVGKTYDLQNRLLQHNGVKRGGGRYTKTRRPVILKYYEEYLTNKMACNREAMLKKLTHQQKNDLINGRVYHSQQT